MEGSSHVGMGSVPPEIMLRILEQAGNFAQQRQVCSSLNQLASVLLLARVGQRVTARIEERAR